MKTKTTVIHHSADHDGIFCCEIARRFLPDAELIGWDFKDEPLAIPDGKIYILDLPVDRVFGFQFKEDENHQTVLSFIKGETPNTTERLMGCLPDIIWIDHHKSSIDTHPTDIPGYRIDGVAACRLAWQWFSLAEQSWEKGDGANPKNMNRGFYHLPEMEDFVERRVSEPVAVRLVGEYDIWDHRGDGDIEFQFGLDSNDMTYSKFSDLLSVTEMADERSRQIARQGASSMRCYAKRDADVMRSRSFIVEWEGLKFLALNTARCNSNTFNALDKPETGHDALMAFAYDGKQYNFSLYHAMHNKGINLSTIAVKYGGGGHAGACGFRIGKLPFIA